VARWLGGVSLPATRLADVGDINQPIIIDNRPVTFWRLVRQAPPRPSIVDLAPLLRQLHNLDVPGWLKLPAFDPFGRVADRLAVASRSVSAKDVEYLLQRLDELRTDYRGLTFPSQPGPVHGDAHPGNLIRSAGGEVLLLDFERFCFGPREWDLSLAFAYR